MTIFFILPTKSSSPRLIVHIISYTLYKKAKKKVRFREGVEIVQGKDRSKMRSIFPPESPPGFDKRNKRRSGGILRKGGTKWKMAATCLHDDVLLDAEDVTSQRPIALMLTLIRWWEAKRASEVLKWQQRYRSEWDAAGGRDGELKCTVWENLMEMWRFKKKKIWERWPWSWTWRMPSSGLVFLRCGPGRRTSASQGRSCGFFVGIFEHPRRVQFERCVAEPLQTISAIVPGSNWSCLLLRATLQDALSEVTTH